MDYQILLINDKLHLVLAELESFLDITLDEETVSRIFEDVENNQISYKTYTLYKKAHWLLPTWEITGAEEYEPETLFLKSSGGLGKRKRFDTFFANQLSKTQ